MPQSGLPSDDELHQCVHDALRSWDRETNVESPFQKLRVFADIQLKAGGSDHQIINQLILTALDKLALQDEVAAQILQRRFLDNELVHRVATDMNLAESSIYRKQNEAVRRLTHVISSLEQDAQAEHKSGLCKRLELPTNVNLVSIEKHLDPLAQQLLSPEVPWFIAIVGMGGIGKTSLADALVRRLIERNELDNLAWVTARQTMLNSGGAITPIELPVVTTDALIDGIISQLLPELTDKSGLSRDEILRALETRLNSSFHVIVIDNLETVADIASLLPLLRPLANPTKFVFTTRESLHIEPDVYHFSVPELSEEDALQLIRQEARVRNLQSLLNADDSQLRAIPELVGGNPLAIRLVVGQTRFHALNQVLNDLMHVRNEKAESLYTYIYRRAWEYLDETSRDVLVAMPLVMDDGGDVEYLSHLTQLSSGELNRALETLMTLNLVDGRGDLNQTHYTIHNLTRAFLHEQVIKWKK